MSDLISFIDPSSQDVSTDALKDMKEINTVINDVMDNKDMSPLERENLEEIHMTTEQKEKKGLLKETKKESYTSKEKENPIYDADQFESLGERHLESLGRTPQSTDTDFSNPFSGA